VERGERGRKGKIGCRYLSPVVGHDSLSDSGASFLNFSQVRAKGLLTVC